MAHCSSRCSPGSGSFSLTSSPNSGTERKPPGDRARSSWGAPTSAVALLCARDVVRAAADPAWQDRAPGPGVGDSRAGAPRIVAAHAARGRGRARDALPSQASAGCSSQPRGVTRPPGRVVASPLSHSKPGPVPPASSAGRSSRVDHRVATPRDVPRRSCMGRTARARCGTAPGRQGLRGADALSATGGAAAGSVTSWSWTRRIEGPRTQRDAAAQLLTHCVGPAFDPAVASALATRTSADIMLGLADYHGVAGLAYERLRDVDAAAPFIADLHVRY